MPLKLIFWLTLVFAVRLFKICTPRVCTAYCSVQLYTRDGQNNGSTRRYRNKTVGVGCTERNLVVNVCGYSFVLLYSVNVNTLQIVFSNSSCESTAEWEACQIFQRTDGWRIFSWSICNQNGHFIRCIQSSSFQGYDGIHKSWDDIS